MWKSWEKKKLSIIIFRNNYEDRHSKMIAGQCLFREIEDKQLWVRCQISFSEKEIQVGNWESYCTNKEQHVFLLQPTSRNRRGCDPWLERPTKLHPLILSIQNFLKMTMVFCVSCLLVHHPSLSGKWETHGICCPRLRPKKGLQGVGRYYIHLVA